MKTIQEQKQEILDAITSLKSVDENEYELDGITDVDLFEFRTLASIVKDNFNLHPDEKELAKNLAYKLGRSLNLEPADVVTVAREIF